MRKLLLLRAMSSKKCAKFTSKLLTLNRQARYYSIKMGVFGNKKEWKNGTGSFPTLGQAVYGLLAKGKTDPLPLGTSFPELS